MSSGVKSKRGRIFESSIFVLFVVSLLLLVLLIVLLTVTFWNVFLTTNKSSFDVSLNEPNTYKILKVDHETNEATFGFVTIYEELESDEFRSYEDSHGNHVLISNFESEEFQCTGSCYCEDFERRSSITISSRRVITYLVAALSSVVAYDLASEYIEKECVKQFEDSCSAIRSEIGKCENIKVVKIEKLENDGLLEYSDGGGEFRNPFDEDEAWYHCRGFCVNMFTDWEVKVFTPDFDYPELFDIMKNFGCEKLKVEKDVKAWTTRQAVDVFMDGDINDVSKMLGFCSQNSLVYYDKEIGGDGLNHYLCRTSLGSAYHRYRHFETNYKNPFCRRKKKQIPGIDY